METTKIDIAIVGGGIVGLWCAYELLKKNNGATIVVFEKETYLGEHTSGRNSEVLHSGIYYEYNSLKHRLCLEGNRLWRAFIKEQQLNFFDCGKYIVSNCDKDKFEALYAKAQKNEVPDIRKASREELDTLNSFVVAEDAFFSPSSAVLDVSSALKKLEALIESHGGIILKNTEVRELKKTGGRFSFKANDDLIESTMLINSAGLYAVELRKQLGLKNYTNRYVKGNYLKLLKKLPVNSLIYPMPPEHGLGLGVHLTLDNQGDQKFGPNTEEVFEIEYALQESLIEELWPSIHEIFYTVKKDELQLAYSGIRPKVCDENGKLMTDFIFNTPANHNVENYFELLGIESPGLTCAPSIAKMLSHFIVN